MKKKLVVCLLLTICFSSIFFRISVSARNEYEYIEQTENEEVIRITEEMSKIYPICPELIQAQIFYESSNNRTIVSEYGDIGYMQVNPRWQSERMEKLGVYDLNDGYSNILVGMDLLFELFQKYGELELVLMAYNEGEERALVKYNSGEISRYAKDIIELSEELERLHGK